MTGLAISEPQGLKEADNCTETTCSLILASLRGTAAHHLNGDAIRVAETARMHLSAGLDSGSGKIISCCDSFQLKKLIADC